MTRNRSVLGGGYKRRRQSPEFILGGEDSSLFHVEKVFTSTFKQVSTF